MSYQEIRSHRLTPEQTADRWLRWSIRVGKGVLVLLVFAAILTGVKQPLKEQNAMRAVVDRLETKAEGLREERDRLLRRLNWIQTDTAYLELEVRDRLNLQKSGEFVLRFEE